MISRLTWGVGVAVTVVMVLLYAAEPVALLQARAALQDGYQRAAPRESSPDSPVHIVDIDEASLREFGQWPWPRTYLAELTDRLFDLGAVTVGYDILFAEPDRTSPDAMARNWGRFVPAAPPVFDSLATLPDHDFALAELLATGPSVLAIAGAEDGTPPDPKAGIAYTGRLPETALTAYPGALSPIAPLAKAATGIGGISLVTGSDGITRSVPMVALYNGQLLPSFTAELLRVAQGAGSHILRTTEASGQVSGGAALPVAMRTGALEYPLDARGHFRIHFSAGRADRTTPVTAILTDTPDADALTARIAGKIVLVGSSAQALFDIRATPLSPEVPGVQLHADILEQILAEEFLYRPDWIRGLEVLLIFVVGLIVTGFAAREKPLFGLVATATSVCALLLGGWLAFTEAGLILNPFEAALTAIAVYLPATTISVFGKERARRRIRERFGHFLQREVVDQIASAPEETLTPSGAQRELTVMFVDMRRFSTLSENMAPEDVVRMLNIYLSAVTDALVASGATIDKFMGDAIMAFWNAPLRQKDHTHRAARAVFAVERAIRECTPRLRAVGLPAIEARVGVNTGPAFVGLMGSEERLNYSCVGDSVTLAARFEALTRQYGVINLLGEETARQVPAEYIAVPIDRVVVKGRSSAATVFTLLHRNPDTTAFAEALAELRAAYLAQDWPRARAGCRALSGHSVEGADAAVLAQVYEARIELISRSVLPPNWDGNFEALAKGERR